jgi:hypothetical protein
MLDTCSIFKEKRKQFDPFAVVVSKDLYHELISGYT